MPFSFRRPTAEKLRQLIASQAAVEFTYPNVGATATLDVPLPFGETVGILQQHFRSDSIRLSPSALRLPPSFTVDHTRVHLGQGAADFASAKQALARWEEFNLGWLSAFPNDAPIRINEVVLVIARASGLWCTNAARIVYTIEDMLPMALGVGRGDGPVRRYGFAYGTLPAHVEAGEERFLIEWDLTTDAVWFDIVAFSQPRHFLVRANRRRARKMQKQFGLNAATAMQGAVLSTGTH